MGFRSVKKGNLVADGSEQTMLETEAIGRISGYVDLAQMEAGDSVTVRQYVAVNGTYRKYHAEEYSGVQANPVVYITPKEIASGLKVSLEQTAGTFRAFFYDFILEEGEWSQAEKDNQIARMGRALGLIQENFFIDSTEYDADGNLTSCRMRLYSSPNVGGNTEVLATFQVEATYVDAKLDTYKVIKA